MIGRGLRSFRKSLRAALLAAALSAVSFAHAHAESAAVPEDVQASLLSKVAFFDKHFAARAGDHAHVLILKRANVADSEYAATNLLKALAAVKSIGGLDHDEAVVAYSSPEKLVDECRAKHAAVVFVTPGFSDEIAKIATALSGVDVLSVTAVPDYVPKGIVVGFDLVSGRPKLLAHMNAARAQNVVFSAEVLRLMKLYP